ncbi:MAG TPA: peptidoglycan-binding protein [Pseudorhizobium sp.]|jgi:predicted chitinase|nr:peptidoglycan-binding protein [Pseudorhizobium sp.]
MDREAFFAALRRRGSGVFGTSLKQGQVEGITSILDEAERRGTRTNDLAYALATVYHETARTMQPVMETLAKNVDTAITRLEKAWKAGKLKWVKTPYWRKGRNGKSWLGRGLVQLTHEDNYRKMSEVTGVDLVANPDRAMEMPIAVKILFDGMERGSFTTKGFNDFIDGLDESDALDRAEYKAARKIINGTDKADLIAGYALAFEGALREAGYREKVADHAPAPPVAAEVPKSRTDTVTVRVVQERLKELGYTEVGTPDGVFGKMTKTAILAFKNENDLKPINDVIDQAFFEALDTAGPRDLPRETVPPEVVRKNAPEVRTNWLIKIGALAAGIPAAIGGLVDGVLDNLGFARETIKPLKEMFTDIPSEVWLIGVAVIAGGAYLVARNGEQKGIAAYQSGERR